MVPARHHEQSVEGDPESEELQTVIDRYERLLRRRTRFRRETDADEEFVWTTGRDRE